MVTILSSLTLDTGFDCNKTINLNVNDAHERAYLYSFLGVKKVLDHFVAERFIQDGDVVVDVGANIGFCSLVYLMNGASTVLAFEPHPVIFNRLKSLEGDDLIVFDLALSNYTGTTELILSETHQQGHTLNASWVAQIPTIFGDNPDKRVVNVSTLDDVLPDTKIDFLKVDIEGTEIEFLQGAKKLLTNSLPRILHIEIYPEFMSKAMTLLTPHYTYIKRCVINNRTQALKLLDITDPRITATDIQRTPPTFICTNDYALTLNYD